MPVTPSEILSMQPRKSCARKAIELLHGFLRPLRNEIGLDMNIGCNDKFIT